MPEYARVCQSMPEYARVCQRMPEYARVCQSSWSMPESYQIIVADAADAVSVIFSGGCKFYRFNAKNWHFRQILRKKVAFFTDLMRKIGVFRCKFYSPKILPV